MQICLLFLLLFDALYAGAQVLPISGAHLNYNQVMLEYEPVRGAATYTVQVAVDSTGAGFGNCMAAQRDSATAVMVSGLPFGHKYMWRYSADVTGAAPVWHGPYYFTIDADSFITRNITGFTVTRNDTGNTGLIVIDGTHTIVDRNGSLVWYLNNVNWFYKYSARTVNKGGVTTVFKDMEVTPGIFDLRLTGAGTVTYLKDSVAIECALNGDPLWQAPNNGQVNELGTEGFNHDFKRLPNGHYMVLGNEYWRRLPPYTDTLTMRRKYEGRQVYNGHEYGSTEFGTVIEYDKSGKAVWHWSSRNYLDSDALKPRDKGLAEYLLKPHINAFSTDLNNEFVYVGLRDISRILKIDKRSGRVVNSWGEMVNRVNAQHIVPLHLQHDANILPNGNIAVFNSNDYPKRDSFASVLILQQPTGKIVWRYDCLFDSVDRGLPRNGGNVDLLKNGNYLVCTGSSDGIFEITPAKHIVWQGHITTRQPDGVKYTHRLYRAHYVSSLYPCYFVFVTGADTVSRKNAVVNIHLFNKGSEDDSYTVKVTGANGKVLKEFVTDTVTAGASGTWVLDLGKHVGGRMVEVSIASNTNADFVRRRSVVLR